MNPFLIIVLTTLFRNAAQWLAGRLGAEVDASTLEKFAIDAAIFSTILGLSLWSKFKSRQKFLTVLASMNLTEKEVEQLMADPFLPTPSVLTKKTEVPGERRH